MDGRKQRVIVYVDGFNFYFGLKAKKWRKYYWLDLVKFFESFLKPHQELVTLKYFSAVQKNSGKADRQDLFFQANKVNSKFHLELGKFLQKKFTCRNCQDSIIQFEEKETDVRIATHMLSDVVHKKCDISILVSADSDLIPPIEAIREMNHQHKIWTYFPPQRYSSDLVSLSDRYVKLERHPIKFDESQLPEELQLRDGYLIKRPKHWK
jgi:uncharacterized LabA/DUF88 family protein